MLIHCIIYCYLCIQMAGTGKDLPNCTAPASRDQPGSISMWGPSPFCFARIGNLRMELLCSRWIFWGKNSGKEEVKSIILNIRDIVT